MGQPEYVCEWRIYFAAQNFECQSPSLKDIMRIGALCNRAKFHPNQEAIAINMRKVSGDASESAILRFLNLVSGDISWWREQNTVVAEIPFNSTSKYQVSIHRLQSGGGHLLVMKGAPEIIVSCCSTILYEGQEYPLDEKWITKFNDAYSELGHLGERVLGFCDYLLPEDEFPSDFQFDTENPNFPMGGLRFVGLVSMLVS